MAFRLSCNRPCCSPLLLVTVRSVNRTTLGPGRIPEETTMRKQRSFRATSLDNLEERIALSQVGGSALVDQIQSLSPPVSVHQLSLNGTITGTFITTIGSSNSQPETITSFQGSGTISGLGQVTVKGVLETLVSTSGQQTTVEQFTLATAQGSVTLQLTKTTPISGSPGATQSSFSIISSTGAFAGDTGSGIADLKMLAELVPVSPPTVARGVFTLTLKADPTIV